MKKTILIFIVFMLWVSLAAAEQAASEKTSEAQSTETPGTDFEGRIGVGYRWMTQSGNPIAGEYDFIKSAPTGALDLEYDPLPHRFVLESYFLNHKDYFGEMDYAYKDVVLFNGYVRDMFHNLNHYSFGPPSTTPGVSFTDKDPGAEYGIENQLRRAFIRFKTPDFPFHLYAEVLTVDREGTIQQRFLREFEGEAAKVSESRDIDWNTQQVRVGANSHLGPVEVDYSHMEKKFEVIGNKELFDVYPPSTTPVPHNLTPELKSSSDTIKIHSSYSGRLVLSGTYTSGDKKNEDSGAKVNFWNSAGDITYMPVTSVIMAVKYRHYNIDATNPDVVNNVTPTGTAVVNVRDAISSSRDVITGTLRYRATDRLTLKGEYVEDTIDRTRGTLGTSLPSPPANTEAFWDVPERTTKGTAKLGLAYRVMNKVTLRADYSRTSVDNPAYDTDPDKSQSARASITWMPTPRFNSLLSYSAVRESRDLLGAPLGGGSREAARDQGLASFTVVVGDRSSITVSYAYFKNKIDQTITYQDGTLPTTTPLVLEPGVPYDDVANVVSIALDVAPVDRVNLTASASRSYSRGNFTLDGAGTVTNVAGIAELSSLKVIDSTYAAGIEMQNSKYVSSELRYQYRKYDDQIDDTQDGTVKTVLATLSMKW
jgi:opacity protein-like surface antigen